MGTAEDLVDLLSQAGLGILGTDLFIGDLPPSPDTATALFESPAGDMPLFTHDIPGIALERPEITLIFRSPSYGEARQRAQEAYTLFPPLVNVYLAQTFYLSIYPLAPPTSLGRDENQRAEISLTLRLEKQVHAEV